MGNIYESMTVECNLYDNLEQHRIDGRERVKYLMGVMWAGCGLE